MTIFFFQAENPEDYLTFNRLGIYSKIELGEI